MRNFYKEYFYVPKHAKIREKVMLTRVVTTVAVIIFSLIAMSISAYAYFSHNVTSGLSAIRTANFETKVQVKITDNEGNILETITPVTSNYKTFKVSGLEPLKKYTVTIIPTEQSSATTGFVTVRALSSEEIYHTQQLGIDKKAPNGKTDEFVFTLSVTNPTDVFLEAHWGTSTYYSAVSTLQEIEDFYITQKEEIEIKINQSEAERVETEQGGADSDPNTLESKENIPEAEESITESTNNTSEN